ncbi:putative nuclease HARBI1 [Ornithodoros turicata]|uniref:putative nuclease HARBI1 n=1 Tax=Ornithodoros turicata TaxID=34597 RepID=UPI003138D4A3
MEVPFAAYARCNNVRRTFRPRSDAFDATDEEFMRLYRLTKPVVRWLCDKLRSTLRPKELGRRYLWRGKCSSPCGFTPQEVSKGRGTAGTPVDTVPDQPDKIREVMREFKSKWRFPGKIGCIDGSVIGILDPSEMCGQYQNSAFFCRKQYFALNAMIVCDAMMHCSLSGGARDAYVWRHSELKRELSRRHSDEPRFLLGDSGYPLQPWLLMPLPGDPPPNTPKARYKKRHKAARGVVEKCIGLLKSRFRCLQRYRTLHYNLHRTSNIVVACAVLHNMCIHTQAPPTEDAGEGDDDSGEDIPATSNPNASPNAPPDREMYDIWAAVRARVIEQLSRLSHVAVKQPF